MAKSDSVKKMVSFFTDHLSTEETMLYVLQSMIAAEVTSRRVEMDMTQKDFAQLLNVSQSTLSKWESGETNFTLSTLVTIASKLDLEIQSPFVPKLPKAYPTSYNNIIDFKPKKQWSSTSADYTYKKTFTETTSLIKEM